MFSRAMLLLAAFLVPLTPAPSRPQEKPGPSVDAFGVSLPPGALARMGWMGFREESDIRCLAVAPDGKTMALGSAGREGTSLRLWDLATGKELRRFPALAGRVRRVAFSPDGKTLAAGSDERGVTLWEVVTGKRLNQILTDSGSVSCLTFSPNGKLLAVSFSKGFGASIRLWDLAAEKETARLEAAADQMLFSPDGRRLLSSWSLPIRGMILIWDSRTGKLLRQIDTEGGAIAISRDGTTAVYQKSAALLFRDLAKDKVLHRLNLGARETEWLLAPGGRELAVRGKDRSIKILDARTGKILLRFPRGPSFRAHRFHFSPDGKTLFSVREWAAHDHAVRLWDVATGQERRPLGGHTEFITSLAFAPDGRTLLSGSADGTGRLWEVRTGKELHCLRGHPGDVTAVAWSPDGSLVASGDSRNEVRLWQPATGREQRCLKNLLQDGQGSPVGVRSLVFPPDGRRFLVGSGDGTITFWETTTGRELHRFKGHDRNLASLALSPDGKILVSPGSGTRYRDGFIRRWDVATGKEIRKLLPRDQPQKSDYYAYHEIPERAAFSPDGRILAVSESHLEKFHGHRGEFGIRLWEMATGKEIFRLDTPSQVRALAFSPDGRVLASDGGMRFEGDAAVLLWDVAAGREMGRLRGHLGRVTALAFSPDGRVLASGSADNTILIWDTNGPGWKGRLRPLPPSSWNLEVLWAELADTDARFVHQAVWGLAAVPNQSLPFLREHLKPRERLDPRRLARLVDDLNSPRYAVRQKASCELAALGDLARPALHGLLEGRVPLEVRLRAERLLRKLDGKAPTPEQLRAERAVAVLEQIRTAGARELLQTLGQGAPGARLTEAARAALHRLTRGREGAP